MNYPKILLAAQATLTDFAACKRYIIFKMEMVFLPLDLSSSGCYLTFFWRKSGKYRFPLKPKQQESAILKNKQFLRIVLHEHSAIFSHFSVGSGIRTKFFQFLNFGELYLDFLQIKFLIWTTDGSWSDWASFEGCSLSCDGGLLTRSRLCISPPAMNGGKECVGPALETVDCNTQPCPTGKLALIVVLFSRRRLNGQVVKQIWSYPVWPDWDNLIGLGDKYAF